MWEHELTVIVTIHFQISDMGIRITKRAATVAKIAKWPKVRMVTHTKNMVVLWCSLSSHQEIMNTN